MTKLNSTVECDELLPTEVSSYLSEFLKGIGSSFDVNVQNIDDSPEIQKLLIEFYENQYEKLDTLGELCREDIDIIQDLSTHEAKIINYVLGGLGATKPFVLLGHAGAGKSTLIKYIAYYLYLTNGGLRNAYYPVYISLSDHSADIKDLQQRSESYVGDFFCLLNKSIYKATRKQIKQYLYFDCTQDKRKEILQWMDANIDELFGCLTEETVKNACTGIDSYVSSLSDDIKEAFFLGVLKYRALNEEIRVTLFLDNIDRFSVDIHFDCLRYADVMQNNGFQLVLAMRYSTYKYIDGIISEKFDNLGELRYSSDTVKSILEKRIRHTEKKIKLNFGYSMNAESIDVITAFSRLLIAGESMNTLVALSNGSLDKLFNKLRVMALSDYFDEKLLAKELINSKLDDLHKTKGIPTWVMYSMLLGNCGGAFKSRQISRTGVINLFCNQSLNHSPYTFFSRIHLLARLFGSAESRNEQYLRACVWSEEYRVLFGNDMNFHATFLRTALRLVQEGLIHTKSCNRYVDEEGIEKQLIKYDSVAISPAGIFYVRELMNKVEYLYFMKDDIRWADQSVAFSLSSVSDSTRTKYMNTLNALLLLFNYEEQMLKRLREESGENNENLVRQYVEKYSPKKCMGSEASVFFTKNIFAKMRSHIESVSPGYIVDSETKEGISLKSMNKVSEVEKSYSF